VIEIDLVPVDAGVYVKLTGAEELLVIVTDVGEKVPPLPESDGVMTSATGTMPFGVTVKDEETPTVPLVPPVKVNAVAGVGVTT
jgi:hypothetical protein